MSELIITEKTNITVIADAVRNKTGSSSGLTLNGIIEGINSISGGTTINLDEEITTQENTIASQDTLIADIVSALESKAVGGGNAEISMVTTTVSDDDAYWADSLTIPELIGAKYFILQGNPLTATNTSRLTKIDDAGLIYQLIYLDGIKITIAASTLGGTTPYAALEINYDSNFDFDATTGIITANGVLAFGKFTVDTSTTGNTYTVYRLA